ncbi:hypothetical protein D9M68_498180 [compost metagenome]
MLKLYGCLAAPIEPIAQSFVVLGLVVGQTISFQPQHFEVVRDRRLDLFFRPVFANANDVKPHRLEQRHHRRFAAREILWPQGTLIGELLTEGDADYGFGIAVFSGPGIAHQVIPGFSKAVLLEKSRAPQT